MKTNVHFMSYLAQFFLEWQMFQTKVVDKIKTHILCSIMFFLENCPLWDNVEKYCIAGQATDNNVNGHVCIACWITKATNTHSQHAFLIALPLQQWLHQCASMLCCTYNDCLFTVISMPVLAAFLAYVLDFLPHEFRNIVRCMLW
jgi:hypothetical protein